MSNQGNKEGKPFMSSTVAKQERRVEDLVMISVDDHIAEPETMFDAHVPRKYRGSAPRVVTSPDGVQQWYYGEIRGRNIGLNAVAGKPREHFNINPSRYEEMRPGCYDVHARVRDMDAGGQIAGLNFPNWPGFAGQVLSQGPDTATNIVMVKAYNDWHIDEWCAAYPGRFIPCGLLPLFDVEEAARELRRLASKGCKAVTFSENPEALKLPSIHTNYWDPLFRAASEEGTVLCLHVGSSSRMPPTSLDAPPSVTVTMTALWAASSLIELLWSGIWSKFPELRFALTEGDIGWIPYFLWKAEQVLDRHSGWTGASFPNGISGPAEVFGRNIYSCFINDPIWSSLTEWVNVDNVFWESDYPHSDSSWPNGPEDLMRAVGNMSDEDVGKVTHLNAIRAYGVNPFDYWEREACTVGALRARSQDVDVVTRVGKPSDESLNAWRQVVEAIE